MTRWLRSFGAFWYDFVIGDDWRGAAVVAVAQAATPLLAHAAVAQAGPDAVRPVEGSTV